MTDENKIKDEELKDANGGIFNLKYSNGTRMLYQTNECGATANVLYLPNSTSSMVKSNTINGIPVSNSGVYSNSINNINIPKDGYVMLDENQVDVNINGAYANGFTLHDSNNNNPNKWVK